MDYYCYQYSYCGICARIHCRHYHCLELIVTTNAFIFSWDCEGIEVIIPITQYEKWDQENLIRLLKNEDKKSNPLNTIIRTLIMRARSNPQRHYEIYAVDCDNSLDEEFWREQWNDAPQATADLIREKGHKLYSDRRQQQYKIV